MSAQANKEVVRRHFALYDRGYLDEDFETCWSKNVRVHGFTPQPLDHAGFKQMLSMFSDAFAESRHVLDLMVAEGDLVATYWTWSGTHRGELMGIPATGRRVSIQGMVIDRIQDGRIVERWGTFDQMALLQQLGAIPAPTSDMPTPPAA